MADPNAGNDTEACRVCGFTMLTKYLEKNQGSVFHVRENHFGVTDDQRWHMVSVNKSLSGRCVRLSNADV